jgi:hypothetical protein
MQKCRLYLYMSEWAMGLNTDTDSEPEPVSIFHSIDIDY